MSSATKITTEVKKAVKKASAAPSAAPSVATSIPTPAPPAAAHTSPTPQADSKKTSKMASPSPSTVVPTPVPVATTTESTETHETSLQDELTAVQNQLTAIRDSASLALAALKRVAKRAQQEIKDARKNKRKRAEGVEGETKGPSNFEKPVPISDELAAFIGVAKGTLVPRTEVNSKVLGYAKQHNLSQGHKINPNAALKKLLNINDTEANELTIFTIQKYLKVHYPKPAKTD